MENRVWVYLSDKIFDDATITSLKEDMQHFLAGWNAHGTALSASADILHKHFIIIKADEEKFSASGCSIDKQFQFVKAAEQKYNLSLLNRLVIAYKVGDDVRVVHSSRVGEMLASGQLNENTIVFNVAVANESELQNNFEIPLNKSWLAKFLVKVK
jgi:hypothetical protein